MLAATNVDLKAAIDKNLFREDLYYRLGVLRIHLPPLRDRGEDTLLMAMVFLKQAAVTYRKPIRGYTAQAVDMLRTYPWPGNVRELSNRVRRAIVMADGVEITPQDLDLATEELHSVNSLDSLRAAHRRIEIELLAKAISLHQGNLTRAARDLEVSRSTLYRKLRAYRLEKFVPAATPHSLSSRTRVKKSATLSAQENRCGESPESAPVGTPLEPVHQLS